MTNTKNNNKLKQAQNLKLQMIYWIGLNTTIKPTEYNFDNCFLNLKYFFLTFNFLKQFKNIRIVFKQNKCLVKYRMFLLIYNLMKLIRYDLVHG